MNQIKQKTSLFISLLVPLLTNCSRAGIPPISNEPVPKQKYPIAVWGSVAPSWIPKEGGRIFIHGTGFEPGVRVFIGDQECLKVKRRDENRIQCKAQAVNEGGKYPLKVVNPDGSFAPVPHEPIEYIDDSVYPPETWYDDGNLFVTYRNY